MAIIVILQTTTASTTRTNPDVKAFSLEGLVYVLLSLALISHASDIYRHFYVFYWLAIGAGALALLNLFTGFKFVGGKTILAVYMSLHGLLILISLPDLTNHEVLLLFVYVLGLFGYYKSKPDPLAILRKFTPLLLAWMYFWASFHKLNSDFFFSPSSCAASMSVRLFDWLPSGGLLTFTAVLIVATEFILGVLVIIPRLHGTFILGAFLFHGLLLFADFAPFTANLYPLLVLLIPTPALKEWLKTTAKRDLFIYAGLVSIGMLLFELLIGKGPFEWVIRLREIPFFVGALPAAWSIYNLLKARGLAQEPEICGLSKKSIYGIGAVLSLLLFFWGGQTYIGLRSNGVFDMYSNIATATGHQNHYLAPHSLSHLFPFQDDLVKAEFASAPKHWKLRRLHNVWVPRVTLMNLTESLYAVEGPVRARLTTAQGQIITEDIANEQNPIWRGFDYETSFWTKHLLDMRPVGTGRCEW